MAELKIYKTFRIKTNELIQDTVEFLVEKFQQSRKIFTVASPFGQILFMLQNLVQLMFYYIEDSLSELNIQQATRNSSRYSLSSIAGHNPTRASAAFGEVILRPKDVIELEIPNNILVLPNFLKLRCTNNDLIYSLYLPAEDIKLSTSQGNAHRMSIIQGTMETQFFTGQGRSFESHVVAYPRNYFIDEHNVFVYVNDVKWKKYKSLLQMPYGEQAYMVRTGVTSGVDVFFGNGKLGKVPPLGSEIRVEYVITEGFAGRIGTNSPTDIVFTFEETAFTTLGEEIDLNEVFNIELVIPPDFGTNPEPIELTKQMLSKAADSLMKEESYELMLKKLNIFSIIKVKQDTIDERVINLFLVPNVQKLLNTNETYFTIDIDRFTMSATKKTQLLKYLDKTGLKTIGTDINILNPVIIKYVMNVNCIVFDDIDPDVIKIDIIQAVSDYFLTINRKDRIPRSDLIRIIENVDGVDSVNVRFISEINEKNKIANPNALDVGIDEFNDIIISDNQLPVIRGGWSDRYGNIYDPGISEDQLGALNIQILDITERPKN